ncbi:MAG: HD-GYP domain-containing protein [Firmicutes bacterium]|nr:HD-GYP domain-containing protein [Bacillota bacterium]
MYEALEIKTPTEKELYCTLKKTIDALGNGLDFADWKLILFSMDKLYGYELCSAQEPNCPGANHKKIFFDRRRQDSYLNALLTEEKVIIHRKPHGHEAPQYSPIAEKAFLEIYYPLFLLNRFEGEIIGCLYLAKYDQYDGDISRLLEKKAVANKIIDICRIVNLIFMQHVKERTLFNLIHVFSEIVKTKEPLLERHPYNVALLSNMIGIEAGLSPKQLYRLYLAGLLHDIGKIYVPAHILTKEASLTKEEMDIIKKHPLHSYNIVKAFVHEFKVLAGIEDIILHHHERYDGTGYPDGLAGEDIPLKSRILAIADAVDAMISKRSYKIPKSPNEIIDDLLFNRGKQFDPDLVTLICKLIRERKVKNDIPDKPIIIGTLELLARERTCQLQGNLIKTNLGYSFLINYNECQCEKCECQLSDLIKATFHTEYQGKIYEYEARISRKDKEAIHLTKLIPKSLPTYFSLPWMLNGVINFKDLTTAEVIINNIGGNSLEFCVPREQFADVNVLDNINSITINFADEDTTVTGKVSRVVRISQRLYCHFDYLNILEATRDGIFRQIFKKQAETNRILG